MKCIEKIIAVYNGVVGMFVLPGTRYNALDLEDRLTMLIYLPCLLLYPFLLAEGVSADICSIR